MITNVPQPIRRMSFNNYKTVDCKFYKQNSFKHEEQKYKIIIPLSNDINEIELLKTVDVFTWNEYPSKTCYEIISDTQFDIYSYFDIILKCYPQNPYFTRHYQLQINHISPTKKQYKLLVTRSSTCS